jgi:hypothetical protein
MHMRLMMTVTALMSVIACAASEAQTAPPSASANAPSAQSAPAQQPAAPAQPAPHYTRLAGVVTAVSGALVSVRSDDGVTTTLSLSPGWLLVIGRPISANDIHPGDFVATANANVDDNSGRSVELRVFPPGVHLGEGSRPMADGNTMTNGTVGEVTNIEGGREMLVRYPGGERHITLPSDIVVVGQRLGDHADLAPGWNVRILATGENGALTTSYIYSGENGTPPPH